MPCPGRSCRMESRYLGAHLAGPWGPAEVEMGYLGYCRALDRQYEVPGRDYCMWHCRAFSGTGNCTVKCKAVDCEAKAGSILLVSSLDGNRKHHASALQLL